MFLDLFQAKERLWLKKSNIFVHPLDGRTRLTFLDFFNQTLLLNVLRHEQMFDRLANLCSVQQTRYLTAYFNLSWGLSTYKLVPLFISYS